MLQAALHIFLAFAIFLSTTGVAIVRHFCHDHLKDVSVMVDMKDCEMEAVEVPACHSAEVMSCCAKAHKDLKPDHSGCCSTQIVFLKLSDQFKYQKTQRLQVPVFAMISQPVKLATVTYAADLVSSFSRLIHSPPLTPDIQVLTGSFLL